MSVKVSKAQLIQIAESVERLEYLGQVDNRLYYRTTGVPGDKPSGYTVIYVEV